MDRQYDDDQMNAWMKSMHTLLKSINDSYLRSSGSISIVPEGLKQSNADAYMPRLVSIGPRFRGSREDLLFMEEIKLQCMSYLLQRVGTEGEVGIRTYLDECSRAIWKLDEDVRASYVADIKLDKHELAKIMLVDGCFLLELLAEEGLENELSSDIIPLPHISPAAEVRLRTNEDVLSDLMLLENQIPILVLRELSRILFRDSLELENRALIAETINKYVLSVLGYSYSPLQVRFSLSATHILDIVHVFVNRKAGAECGC